MFKFSKKLPQHCLHLRRTVQTTRNLLERNRFASKDPVQQPNPFQRRPESEEIKNILGLDESIDKEGKEILEQFYVKNNLEPEQTRPRFNKLVYEKESMPAVTPWNFASDISVSNKAHQPDLESSLLKGNYADARNKLSSMMEYGTLCNVKQEQIIRFLDLAIEQSQFDSSEIISGIYNVITSPNIELCNKLMKLFSQHRESLTLAQELLNRMKIWNLSPSTEILNNFLSILLANKKISEATHFFENAFLSTAPRDNHTKILLINGYLSAHKVKEAEKLFEYTETKLSDGYESFIKYFLQNEDYEQASRYITGSINSGTVLSLETMALIVQVYVQNGECDKALDFLNAVEKLDKEALHPQLYGLIARDFSSKGNFDAALDLLESMMQNLKLLPDEMTYNALIQNISQKFEYNKANDLAQHMFSHNLQPDITSLECLVEACAGTMNADKTRNLITELESKHIPITIRMYNALLIVMDAEHDYQGAIQLYNQIKNVHDTELNEITLQTILNVYIKCNKVFNAIQTMESLLERNLKLAHSVAVSIFEICVRGRKYQDAVKLLALIRKKDAMQDSVKLLMSKYSDEWESALKHLLTVSDSTSQTKFDIDSNVKEESNDVESHKNLALHLYKELLTFNIKLSPSTVALIIRLYRHNRDLVSAVRAWTIMQDQKLKPNEVVIVELLHTIRDLGQARTVNVIIKMRENDKWPLNKKICEHFMVIMSRHGYHKELIRLIMDMLEANIQYTIENHAIIISTMQSYKQDMSIKKFREFIEETCPAITENYEDKVEKIRLKTIIRHK